MKLPFYTIASRLIGFPSKILLFGLAFIFTSIWQTAPVHAANLIVWYEEVGADVRITIDTWQIPEGVDVTENGAVSIETNIAYDVSIGEYLRVRYTLKDEQYWVVGLLGPGFGGTGIIDYSNLKEDNITGTGNGSPGGINLRYDETADATFGIFAFQQYDSSTRLATFNVQLLLPNTSFAILFEDTSLLYNEGFTVWNSDHFDVKFAAVPEPGAFGLILGAGLFLLIFTARNLSRSNANSLGH